MGLIFACLMAVAVDGDTIRCANIEAANGRVRLARIASAELDQHGGREARAALEAMITGPVTCEHLDADPRIPGFQGTDRFGRLVARCGTGQGDFGARMIDAGHARSWPSPRR